MGQQPAPAVRQTSFRGRAMAAHMDHLAFSPYFAGICGHGPDINDFHLQGGVNLPGLEPRVNGAAHAGTGQDIWR